METDLVLATRIELMEDEICRRGTRLNDRIHEVERALGRLADGAHDTLCGGGPLGIDVRTVRLLDLFEEIVGDVDAKSIRREAEELSNLKALADAMHHELTGYPAAQPAAGRPRVLTRAA
jgi:hypothetical protein